MLLSHQFPISSSCRYNWVQIYCHDLDLSGSRDIFSHMTIRFFICHFLLLVYCNQVYLQPFSRYRPRALSTLGSRVSTHDLDLSGSRDVISHVYDVTWPFESQWAISYWWSIVTKSVSPTVFDIQDPKHNGATILTFLGHVTDVTSSVTWPFDSQVAISYRCSIGTKCVSPAVFEIMGPKYIVHDSWPFWVTWRHQSRSRDHLNSNMSFPIGGQL